MLCREPSDETLPSQQGKTYDDEDWEDYESDPEVPHEEIFHLGRFCAEKCVFHHELKRE